jgi:hypothetical protein
MGIFFDTYSNVQQGHQQYASIMIGDGNQVYDHERDGGEAKIAGAFPGERGGMMMRKGVTPKAP